MENKVSNILSVFERIVKSGPVIIEWVTNKRYYEELASAVAAQERIRDHSLEKMFEEPEKAKWALQLKQVIESQAPKVAMLTVEYEAFASEFAYEPSEKRRLELALEYYKKLFPQHNEKKARKAFAQYLELETFLEAYRREADHLNILAEKAFDLIGELIAICLDENFSEPEKRVDPARRLLSEFSLEKLAFDTVFQSPKERTRLAALNMLLQIASVLPAGSKLPSLDNLQLLIRMGQNTIERIWIQIKSLDIVTTLFPDRAMPLFKLRLLAPGREADDNLFVRKWIVDRIGERFVNDDGFALMSEFIREPDPSDYVRLAAARNVGFFGYGKAASLLYGLSLEGPMRDVVPQVRAGAIEGLTRSAIIAGDEAAILECASGLCDYLKSEPAMFAQRICLERMAQLVSSITDDGLAMQVAQLIMTTISSIVEDSATTVKVRYWAVGYREQIVLRFSPELQSARKTLSEFVEKMVSGQKRKIPPTVLEIDRNILGRTLAEFSRNDFGYYVTGDKKKPSLEKGERFRFQLWRLLFEIGHPSPDKRRNYDHTKGRHFSGPIRAHSDVLGELTTTKVPGEPLVIWDEGSWRRYVPLVDDCLSLLREFGPDREVRLYSSHGVTTLYADLSLKMRRKNRIRMVRNYERIAALRNSHPGNKQYPDLSRYFKALREEYGIQVTFEPYQDRIGDRTFAPLDPSIAKAFGAD